MDAEEAVLEIGCFAQHEGIYQSITERLLIVVRQRSVANVAERVREHVAFHARVNDDRREHGHDGAHREQYRNDNESDEEADGRPGRVNLLAIFVVVARPELRVADVAHEFRAPTVAVTEAFDAGSFCFKFATVHTSQISTIGRIHMLLGLGRCSVVVSKVDILWLHDLCFSAWSVLDYGLFLYVKRRQPCLGRRINAFTGSTIQTEVRAGPLIIAVVL